MFAIAFKLRTDSNYTKVDTGKVWATKSEAEAALARTCFAPMFYGVVVELR